MNLKNQKYIDYMNAVTLKAIREHDFGENLLINNSTNRYKVYQIANKCLTDAKMNGHIPEYIEMEILLYSCIKNLNAIDVVFKIINERKRNKDIGSEIGHYNEETIAVQSALRYIKEKWKI